MGMKGKREKEVESKDERICAGVRMTARTWRR